MINMSSKPRKAEVAFLEKVYNTKDVSNYINKIDEKLND
jgi:hypothetical protein